MDYSDIARLALDEKVRYVMREKRWTRGEWSLSSNSNDIIADGSVIAMILIPDGCAGQRAEREEQAVANAHLIAAAPEHGTGYWTINATQSGGVVVLTWRGNELDYRTLNANAAFATESGARAAFEALSKVLGGETG